GEDVTAGEREQGRVAAGAAADDREAPRIDFTDRREVLRRVDAVLEVDDAPLSGEELAVRTAEARRAAVVDVDDSPATRRQELDRQRKCELRLRRGAAVQEDTQRRQLAGRGFEVGVRRRVVEGMRRAAACALELDRTADGDRLALQL